VRDDIKADGPQQQLVLLVVEGATAAAAAARVNYELYHSAVCHTWLIIASHHAMFCQF